MKLKFLISSLLVLLGTSFASDNYSLNLKGNVQTQATKSIEDEENNLSSLWLRANLGAEYKSDAFDALVMMRIFAPEFGNNIDGKNYDKILADLYWVNYKWKLGESTLLNLKLGHWKTDWSQSTHFGTYIDKDLSARGLWMRDQAHNAMELGFKHGLSQLNVMLATSDNKANTGYVRVEESLKFTFPLEMKFAYRTNAIDVVQNTSYITHRIATYASFSIIPNLRLYGELACFYTQDEDLVETVPNFVRKDPSYLKPGEAWLPFYVGLEIPTFGVLDNFLFEVEYIKDRDEVSAKQPNASELAWTAALVKKLGKSKLQFSVYSEEELNDIGLAFRLTSTIR